MGSPRVVELKKPGQAFTRGRDTVVGAQINLFVFDCPSEPFHKDVVPPRAMGMYLMSIAQTWLRRVTASFLSRNGKTLWPGAGFDVFGLRYSA